MPSRPGDLKEPMAPLADETEDRGRLRRVAQVVEEKPGGLVVEYAEGAQHQ